MLSEPRGGPSRDVTRQMIPEDRKEKAVGVRQQSDQNTGDSWMGGWRGERTERERGETNKRQTTGKRVSQRCGIHRKSTTKMNERAKEKTHGTQLYKGNLGNRDVKEI